MGRGSEVSYDLAALEKHILDRFIHGKPTILVDIPQVSTAATFEAVRKKVSPQVYNIYLSKTELSNVIFH